MLSGKIRLFVVHVQSFGCPHVVKHPSTQRQWKGGSQCTCSLKGCWVFRTAQKKLSAWQPDTRSHIKMVCEKRGTENIHEDCFSLDQKWLQMAWIGFHLSFHAWWCVMILFVFEPLWFLQFLTFLICALLAAPERLAVTGCVQVEAPEPPKAPEVPKVPELPKAQKGISLGKGWTMIDLWSLLTAFQEPAPQFLKFAECEL